MADSIGDAVYAVPPETVLPGWAVYPSLSDRLTRKVNTLTAHQTTLLQAFEKLPFIYQAPIKQGLTDKSLIPAHVIQRACREYKQEEARKNQGKTVRYESLGDTTESDLT